MYQSERRINLTGIHAMNWYGYTHDHVAVNGNLLLAGVMGSGKSILMDLIQHVIVGHQKSRYNVSATGATSGRTLKGYCLGDLKSEVEGITQYMRPRGAVSLIALEFTWPDGERKETWGFRIEFENATQPRPSRNDPFFVRDAITSDQLVSGAPARPLDYPAFKQLVADLDGKVFDTIDEYRRDMANHSHLNFSRDTLDYLLPSAMSFTFLEGGFNRFCRLYILPNEPLKIDDVRDSYRAFKALEIELEVLRDKLSRLEKIREVHAEWCAARSDLICYDLLQHEFAGEAAQAALDENTQRIAQLDKETTETTRALDKARSDKGRYDGERTQVLGLFNETEDGRAFLILKQQNTELVADIARLKDVGKSVDEAVANRVRRCRLWIERAQSGGFDLPGQILTAASHAADELANAQPVEIRERTRALGAAMKAAREAIHTATRDVRKNYGASAEEMRKLQMVIGALRLGALAENATLLNAINAALPHRDPQPTARALRQLCEVGDERWRAALEVVFSQKFAVVVSAEDYPEAQRIFHALKENVFPESLVIPQRARSLPGECRPGSLASKLETSHPVARALIDHLLGDIICVERREELLDHDRAILPDGFMIRGAFNVRPRHYDYRPCIGERGIEKQRGFLQDQFDAFKRDNERLQPALDLVESLSAKYDAERLAGESVHDDLADAMRLPDLQAKLKTNIDHLNRIRSGDLGEKEERLRVLDNELKRLNGEIEKMLKSGIFDELERARKLRESLVGALGSEKQRLQNKATELADRIDVARKDELARELRELFQQPDVCAAQCRLRHGDQREEVATKWTELTSFRREMADRYGALRDDPTYAIDSEENTAFATLLDRLCVTDMPAIQAKAARERINWQNLFRTTVAAKLTSALRNADDLKSLMNTQLNRRIGNHIYQISKVDNPDREYAGYRDLLAACAAAGEGDLFASLEGDVRERIETLFDTLVEQPDSRAALAFLDYRNYHDYDLKVRDVTDPTAPPVSIDRQADKMSGGENQSPYFIAILACYLRAYKRHLSGRSVAPSLCLVPIDEAFSKMSGDGIRHSIDALRELDLQGFLSMSSGNIPYAIDGCDQVLTVSKKKTHHGAQEAIRNIAVSLTREEALARYCKR